MHHFASSFVRIRTTEARNRAKSPERVASLSSTAAGLLRVFLQASRTSRQLQESHCVGKVRLRLVFIGWPFHPSLKGCGASPHPLKDARPETRDCVSRCSVALHTASHRLAERNRYVALRSLFMSGLDAPVSPCLQFRLRRFPPSLPSPSVSSSLPAPTCSASTSGSDCPPPARLSRGKDRSLVLERDCQCKLPYTVLPRISRIKTGACRGLRPCPLCHLCPTTATADSVAASGPKQHRPSVKRPLQRRCEFQRLHPPEGCCWEYIYLFFGRSRAAARQLSYVIH